MQTPLQLKPGDLIRVVSPAGRTNRDKLLPAISWYENKGFRIETGANAFKRHFQFAGTDNERLDDLQQALSDMDAKAIICSRGGYGTIRLLDQLDFSDFLNHPKWIVGYSDVTLLHACVNKLGIASIHGTMLQSAPKDSNGANENLDSVYRVLKGESVTYRIPHEERNVHGSVSGEIIGGNLSIISSLMGTPFEIDTYGKILFLEEIDEYLYHIDRMVRQLKLAGKLDQLAGVIVGDFTHVKDNENPFGKSVPDIILEALDGSNIPVCFGFPGGHEKRNLALPFGLPCNMEVNNNETVLQF